MTKNYFVVVNENGEEISRSEVPVKKGVFETLKEKHSEFATKHPKIDKGLKIGGVITAVVTGTVVGAAIANRRSDSDGCEYLPDNTVDALPDYSEPESDTDTETDVDEAPETTE